MIENKRIQIRRDIALNWTTKNPVLLYGEVGFDMTANNIKIGDGITPWNDLDYISAKVDLSEYYTKEQVDDLIDRIDIPDITQYYTKEETETKIEEAIGGIEIPETDLTNYYTKEETETKIEEAVEGIEFPTTDLSDYYTKEETETKIEEAVEGIEFPTTDLSNYYTKEETDSLIEVNTPDVYDSKITIQQGTKTQTFTLNQDKDALIELDAGGEETANWYGTEQQWASLPREQYQDNTTYYISELSYNELKNKPLIPNKTSQLNNDRGFTTKEKVKDIISKTEWFGTQEEFDALESYNPNVIYYVEVSQDMTEYYSKAEVDALLNEIRGLITQ